MILDTTAALKETIAAAHDVLEFADIGAALVMAAKWIELNAALTCSGAIPEQWRPFGEFRPGSPVGEGDME